MVTLLTLSALNAALRVVRQAVVLDRGVAAHLDRVAAAVTLPVAGRGVIVPA